MSRHGSDIQPIRIDMRFLYARCEIHIQRYDIHIEPIQDRHEIDIRLIDDVYESTWHWYTTYQNRYALYIRSMWNPYTAIWHPYRIDTGSIWHWYTIYRRRIWIDMALVLHLPPPAPPGQRPHTPGQRPHTYEEPYENVWGTVWERMRNRPGRMRNPKPYEDPYLVRPGRFLIRQRSA